MAPNLPVPSGGDVVAQPEHSTDIALLPEKSRTARTIADLNVERDGHMHDIKMMHERHNEAMQQIDDKWRRAKLDPTDSHQLLVGFGIWMVFTFAIAFAFHTVGVDLAQIEINLVIADVAFIVALAVWVASTAVFGILKENAATKTAEIGREVQAQKLASDTAAAEATIREIDATVDRIRARVTTSSAGEPATGSVRINQRDGAEMVYISAGVFIMGTDETEINEIPMGPSIQEIPRQFFHRCLLDNGPRREVYLDGYWIYRYPVTIGQYRAYCAATRAAMPRDVAVIDDEIGDKHPIDRITWHSAKAYCDWAGTRLCTEAEWEKAMRGPRGQRFPWGDTWDPKLPARTDNWTNRTAMDAFDDLASPYGVVEFYSEAGQWCEDLYIEAAWSQMPSTNPRGPAGNKSGERVIRGGGSGDDPMGYLPGKRYFCDPFKTGQCGFRPAFDGD